MKLIMLSNYKLSQKSYDTLKTPVIPASPSFVRHSGLRRTGEPESRRFWMPGPCFTQVSQGMQARRDSNLTFETTSNNYFD